MPSQPDVSTLNGFGAKSPCGGKFRGVHFRNLSSERYGESGKPCAEYRVWTEHTCRCTGRVLGVAIANLNLNPNPNQAFRIQDSEFRTRIEPRRRG